MKKTLFILLVIASLTACGGKKDKIEIPLEETTKVQVVETLEENISTEDTQSDEVQNYHDQAGLDEKVLKEICVVDEVKGLGDPELTQLYGDLALLQERADEWAKIPGSLEDLKEISEEIGRLKGRIAYRSLRIYSTIN